MERRKLRETRPDFVKVCLPYVHKRMRVHFWRIAGFMEYEDALQEAYLAYVKCCNIYPQIVEPAHFFAMYKLVFTGRFINLADAAIKHRKLSYVGDLLDSDAVFPALRQESDQEARVAVMERLLGTGLATAARA